MNGIRTINDLRDILADEIQKIRDGKSNAANVNAITNATGKILSSVKLEIEYNKLLGKIPVISYIKVSDATGIEKISDEAEKCHD